MVSTITALYIIKIAAITVSLLALFYSYAKTFSRLVPTLSGLPGGFVLFLATNELLALPFLVFHLSFNAYYPIFVVVNGAILVRGLYLYKKIKTTLKPKVKISPLLILALILTGFCIGLTHTYVKYDEDDSFYVSLVQQNKNNSHLYSTDPSSGNANLKTSVSYQFEGWELIESSLSKTFSLTSLEVAHGLVPVFVVILVFALFLQIFKYLIKDDNLAYLALSITALIFIYGGYSRYSQGTFLLARAWLGKAIIGNFIVPMLSYALFRAWLKPKDNKIYLAIFAINISSVALNPAGIYISVAAAGSAALVFFVKQKSIVAPIKIMLATTPALLAGLAMVYANTKHAAGSLEGSSTTTYLEFASRFMGKSWYFLATVVGLLAFRNNDIIKKGRFMLYWLPLGVLLTTLNPLLFPIVKRYVASNTYWRLFWLIPITFIIPLLGVVVYSLLSKAYDKKLNQKIQSIFRVFTVGLILIAVALGGRYVFNTEEQYLVARDFSTSKVPSGVEGVSLYLDSAPCGTVLASRYPAAYLHTFTSKDPLLISRPLYIAVYYAPGTQDNKDRNALFRSVTGSDKALTHEELNGLFKKYQIQYLVFANGNIDFKDLSEEYSFPEVYKNETYTITKTPYISCIYK